MQDNKNKNTENEGAQNNEEELESLIASAIAAKKKKTQKVKTKTAKSSPAASQSDSKADDGIPDLRFSNKSAMPIAAVPASAKVSDGKPSSKGKSTTASAAKKKSNPQRTDSPKKKTPSSQSNAKGETGTKAKAKSGSGSKSNANTNTKSKQGIKSKQNTKPNTNTKAKPSSKKAKPADENEENEGGWSKKKKFFVALGCVFLLLCLLAFVVLIIFHSYFSLLGGEWDGDTTSEKPTYSDVDSTKEDTIDAQSEDEKLKEQLEKSATNIMSDSDVFNVLLIGEDLRDTAEDSRGNTDVMMLISINQRLKTITMSSFLRDTYVYFSDWNYSNRLNAAYWHGGPEYLETTIESYFGVEIDRYAIVNFNQFITIVDTLGGLTLDVSDAECEAMVEPQNEQNMYLGQDFGTDILESGGEDLLLNGNQALAYARIRKGVGDDYGRTKRQRLVIAEMINKAKQMTLTQLNDLLNQILPNVYTDIEEGEALSLLLNAFEYMSYDIQQLQIPADGTFTDETIDGMDVLSVNFDKNAQLLQETIYGESTIDDFSTDSDDDSSSGYYDDYGNWVSSGNSANTSGNTYGYYDDDGDWVAYVGGYYDSYGNWVSTDSSDTSGNTYGYYDDYGNWIAYSGGYYDKYGNWVSY